MSENGPPYEPVDRDGAPIRVGSVVRIVGTPDFEPGADDPEMRTRAVFAHILGTYKRVRDVTELGLVELSFEIRAGEAAGHHWVWIEPFLVRVRRSRVHTS